MLLIGKMHVVGDSMLLSELIQALFPSVPCTQKIILCNLRKKKNLQLRNHHTLSIILKTFIYNDNHGKSPSVKKGFVLFSFCPNGLVFDPSPYSSCSFPNGLVDDLDTDIDSSDFCFANGLVVL